VIEQTFHQSKILIQVSNASKGSI